MAKNRNNVRKSMARIVIDVFLKNQATSEDKAISIDKFKDVKLTSESIAYTIANLIEDGVVIKLDNEKFYFDQLAWDRLEKKVMRQYWLIFIGPIVIILFIMILLNINNLKALLFK